MEKRQKENWDLVILPDKAWWKIDLKSLWEFRDLLLIFIKRDLVATYKQTVLGPVWFFLQPALTTFVFTVIFSLIARIGTNGMPAPVFYICGIVIWNYFADSLTATAATFQSNADVFGKVYFPRLIAPLSRVLSGLVRFFIQLILVLLLVGFYGLRGDFVWAPGLGLLWLPLLLLSMLLLGLGLGMIVSSLTTKYRDLGYLLTFGVQLLMYGSAVVIPISAIATSGLLYELFYWNPLAQIVEGFRAVITGVGQVNVPMVFYAFGVSVCCLFIGIFTFNRVEKSFIDVV